MWFHFLFLPWIVQSSGLFQVFQSVWIVGDSGDGGGRDGVGVIGKGVIFVRQWKCWTLGMIPGFSGSASGMKDFHVFADFWDLYCIKAWSAYTNTLLKHRSTTTNVSASINDNVLRSTISIY